MIIRKETIKRMICATAAALLCGGLLCACFETEETAEAPATPETVQEETNPEVLPSAAEASSEEGSMPWFLPGGGSVPAEEMSESEAEPGTTAEPETSSGAEESATDPAAEPVASSGEEPESTLAEPESTSAETETTAAEPAARFEDGAEIGLSPDWKYAEYSAINSGHAVFYAAQRDRNGIVVAVNAGHGTKGGTSVKTWCHPDHSEKVTGGSTAAGATKAWAVSTGMDFDDGTPERTVTLREARILRDELLSRGYDVLMLRDDADVQLDNIARTVIANNTADCHIAVHWDGDGLSYDKGCFYMSVPDALKHMDPVRENWERCEALGDALIRGLEGRGSKIWSGSPLDVDLTQTSYSTIASVDIELGNETSDHSDDRLYDLAEGLADGIDEYFGR